ncbi:MAG TPA: HEAT repeat domain-containing protein [Vicinamibacterales bacterium]|nr:HEAT repeat domain-containing protein [Vicinamibacterales bacterium]
MSQVSQLSPELTRGLLQLARALLVAARNWTLYPSEHPTVGASVARLGKAIHESSLGAAFAVGVTPDTLMIEGTLADTSQTGIAEAAALLHDCDILTLTFIGDVPEEALHALLRVITLDPSERRSRGGPAVIWSFEAYPSIAIEQIDYERVLAREEGVVAEPAKRDELWRSIVLSISGGQKAVFDERAQQRLLAIAGSPMDIADLATAVSAPKCAMDGSPMITTQAATVLAAFRHLTSIVSVAAPERMHEVMNNVTAAAAQLDPHVVMQVMQSQDESGGVQVVRGMAAAFDDVKVAQLLATALALDGQASDRLATIFNTIAPDENRKRRVLTLTRNLLSETDFGRSGQFQVLWASTEELLVSYNDKPFVSETYRRELDGVGGRADRMATGDLPADLPEWMKSLGQDNVRGLSVTMLIDLFTIEDDPARAAEIAGDMEALTEDLLMAGAYDDALTVIRALQKRATTARSHGQEASRVALDHLGDSLGMRETVALVGDVDDEAWQAIRSVIQTVGAATIEAIKPVLLVEQDTAATTRGEELILGFGAKGVGRLASLVGDSRWFVQRRGARLLGRIAAPEAVPLLQPLLRQADPRVARQAVAALGAIQDPAAARAIQTVLRAASGELRKAVTEALVAERDPRVVPMLVRILEESQPLGKDHDMVLETIDALATVGTDGAVPILSTMARRTSLFGRKKARALKERSIDALARVGTPKSTSAIKEAAQQGDRMLRKIAAGRSRG